MSIIHVDTTASSAISGGTLSFSTTTYYIHASSDPWQAFASFVIWGASGDANEGRIIAYENATPAYDEQWITPTSGAGAWDFRITTNADSTYDTVPPVGISDGVWYDFDDKTMVTWQCEWIYGDTPGDSHLNFDIEFRYNGGPVEQTINVDITAVE